MRRRVHRDDVRVQMQERLRSAMQRPAPDAGCALIGVDRGYVG